VLLSTYRYKKLNTFAVRVTRQILIMKRIFIILSVLIVLTPSANSQTFTAERSKDIQKFDELMIKLESSYFKQDTRSIKRSVKNLTKIMAREIKRTTKDIVIIKHELYAGNQNDRKKRININVISNRLEIMEYIKERVITFDMSKLYDYSEKELGGFKAGLNHFNDLMKYNLKPELAIHRIPANAKWIRTPAEKKNQKN
jgi:hypothetical protein